MLLDNDTAEICRTLAPLDLASVPLYVVRQSALPPNRGGNSLCWGYTSPNLDVQLEDLIDAEWEGRGAAMVVNDGLAAMVDAYTHHARDLVRSVALHELAHVLERERGLFYGLEDANPAEVAVVALAVGKEVATDRPVNVANHGPMFVRIACHLIHRATVSGLDLCPRVALGGYGLKAYSGLRAYLAALEGEPERMAQEPFSVIRRLPIPPPFIELWQHDAGQLDWKVHP